MPATGRPDLMELLRMEHWQQQEGPGFLRRTMADTRERHIWLRPSTGEAAIWMYELQQPGHRLNRGGIVSQYLSSSSHSNSNSGRNKQTDHACHLSMPHSSLLLVHRNLLEFTPL